MISPRRLVAFLLLASLSLAVILPFSGVGLLWAVCAPLLILFGFVSTFGTSIEIEDTLLPEQILARAIGPRAPPLT